MATPKRKTDHAFNIQRLNVVFLFSALALIASVIWMVIDDYDREWKHFQRDFFARDRERARLQIEELDEQNQAALEQAQESKTQTLTRIESDIEAKRDQLDKLQREQIYRADQLVKFARAKLDVLRYEYESELTHFRVEHGEGRIDPAEFPEGLRDRYDLVVKNEQDIAKLSNDLNELKKQEKSISDELGELEKQVTVYDDEIRSLTEKRDILARKIERTESGFRNTVLDRTPMMDFIDPVTKVEWVKPPNLRDDLNFTQAERIDMCKTCHMAIDGIGYTGDNWEHPFRSHPRLDLFVSPSSPHSYLDFGCTVCHQGRGQDLTFKGSAHVPRDDAQREQWEEKYGWTPKAFMHWEFPMVPTQYIYSSCLKCHGDSWTIPEAGPTTVELAASSPAWNTVDEGATLAGHNSVNAGRMIFYEYGCHGCHAMKDFESPRKVGPDLRQVGAKLEPDWVYAWLLDPKAFRPTTKMPKFFGLSNSGGELDTRAHREQMQKFNQVEADSITAFLFQQSVPMDLPLPDGLEADTESGKTLFENRGCLGCHAVDSLPFAPGNNFGPNLSRVGEKLNLAWLYHWVKDPKQYHPDGRMPSLRLEDQEALDIASYLLEAFQTESPFRGSPDRSDADYLSFLDARIIENYLDDLPIADAQAKADAMSLDQKRTFVGQKLVERYGCTGCHWVNGYEDAKGIGAELSEHGTKDLHTVDFGLELHEVDGVDRVTGEEKTYHIDHTLHSWLGMKIRYPRIFDRGRYKAYKDASRMPNFEFKDDQIEALVTYLFGNRKELIPEIMKANLQGDAQVIAGGERIIHDSNCYGCHQFEMHEISYLDDDALRRHAIGQVTEVSVEDEVSFFRAWTDQIALTQKGQTDFAAAQTIYGADSVPIAYEMFSNPEKIRMLAGEKITDLESVSVLDPVGTTLELGVEADIQADVSLFTAIRFIGEDGQIHLAYGKITSADLEEGSLTFGLMKPIEELGLDAFAELELTRDKIVQLIDPSLALGGRLGRSLELAYAQNEDLDPFDTDEYFNDIQPTIDPYKPPVLFREGQKIQTPWAFEFLMNPYPLRPWFEVRMPTFGFTQEEATTLANYFGAKDRRQYPYNYYDESAASYLAARSDDQPEQYLENAWALMQDPQVNCFNCHMQGEKTPEGDPSSWAPDLSMAHERLRPEWIRSWIFDPQGFQPGTKMPQLFLSDEERYQEAFAAPSGHQVEAIKDLLMNWTASPAAASNPR